MCSERRKNHGCGQKQTKKHYLCIFGVETAAKSCELKRCADRGSLTNLFLNFVVFACFATTRVNMRFLAKTTRDSAQGYIQCMKCIGNPLVRTDGRTEVRTNGRSLDCYVTTKISWLDRLPNFLSNRAPLTRWRAGSAMKLQVTS